MTADEITKKLNSRYNWENKMSLAEDLSQMLKKYSVDELSRIWERFDATYTSMVAPKPAHFYGIASDLGISGRGNKGEFHGAYKCECGAKYSMESSNCPKCGSPNQVGIVDAAGLDIIECQHDCYHCDIYNGENKKGVLGPTCNKFALGETISSCNYCRCKACCEYEKDFRADERNNTFYTEGREMPWIGEAGKGVTQRVSFESLMAAVKANATKYLEEEPNSVGYRKGWIQKYRGAK